MPASAGTIARGGFDGVRATGATIRVHDEGACASDDLGSKVPRALAVDETPRSVGHNELTLQPTDETRERLTRTYSRSAREP